MLKAAARGDPVESSTQSTAIQKPTKKNPNTNSICR